MTARTRQRDTLNSNDLLRQLPTPAAPPEVFPSHLVWPHCLLFLPGTPVSPRLSVPFHQDLYFFDAATSSLSTPSSLPTSHGPLRQFLLPISPIPMLHCRPFAPTCKNWGWTWVDWIWFHSTHSWWLSNGPNCPTSLCPLPLAVSPHGP